MAAENPSDLNPYQSPNTAGSLATSGEPPNRSAARENVRRATLILAVAGAFNFFCFHLVGPSADFYANTVFGRVCMATNLLVFVSMLAFYWLAGLWLFDRSGLMFHWVFGGRARQQDWLTSMYDSLETLPRFALAGTAVWSLWLLLFYFTHAPAELTCILALCAGYLLAAGFYGILLYKWYLVRKEARWLP